ncbi:hypothetical protein E2C01_011922 [Portunus trituberculatus]|uniref:Uncharacterized protein n=1 Tax=Portunus trituberculatus TaxID=210409 RepID=A0A5B7DCS1_PORTR|nr:hypothetical protein [Portunus trituberculatus]
MQASECGLASYTPSKIQIGSTFELGVSRTAPTVQTSPPAPPPQTQKAEDEYLRPADESETMEEVGTKYFLLHLATRNDHAALLPQCPSGRFLLAMVRSLQSLGANSEK